MIYLFSGTPGSGKSCHQAEMILDWVSRGGVVIANYPIDETRIKKYKGIFVETTNQDITPSNLIEFSRMLFTKEKFREGRIKLLIDESQIMFNCREWDRTNRAEWISFFTQHRKYGYDIYLIAQFDRMLDRQIRSLIEYEYIHRRLSNAGVKGAAMSLVLGGNTYMVVKVWYPMKEKIGQEIHHIRKRYYSLYDSYKQFETDNAS